MEVTIQPPKVKEYTEADGSGRVELSVTWRVSARQATRTAGRIAGEQVSLLLIGGTPALSIGDQVTWRVPITLQLGPDDSAEIVGYVSIDANSGEPVFVEKDLQQIKRMAERHAERTPALAVVAG